MSHGRTTGTAVGGMAASTVPTSAGGEQSTRVFTRFWAIVICEFLIAVVRFGGQFGTPIEVSQSTGDIIVLSLRTALYLGLSLGHVHGGVGFNIVCPQFLGMALFELVELASIAAKQWAPEMLSSTAWEIIITSARCVSILLLAWYSVPRRRRARIAASLKKWNIRSAWDELVSVCIHGANAQDLYDEIGAVESGLDPGVMSGTGSDVESGSPSTSRPGSPTWIPEDIELQERRAHAMRTLYRGQGSNPQFIGHRQAAQPPHATLFIEGSIDDDAGDVSSAGSTPYDSVDTTDDQIFGGASISYVRSAASRSTRRVQDPGFSDAKLSGRGDASAFVDIALDDEGDLANDSLKQTSGME